MSTTSTKSIPNPNTLNTPKPQKLASKKTTASPSQKPDHAETDISGSKADDDLLKKLEIKLRAINANNIARVANSHLSSSEDKLYPLISLKTGKAIEKFPATSKDIVKLNLVVIDSILNTLDADRTGNEAAKREKLRLQIGLRPYPA